ncbi:MAG: hypothetical protein EPO67_02320, partial [Reyranella sp.]
MVFRRILALGALLAGLAACTLQDGSPQTSAATASGSGTIVLPANIEKIVGPVYQDAALQAYVDRVGRRLLTASAIGGTYRFGVLDSPVPNAHAVQNYVFVTRGLLALLEDEAELAAALG